MKPLHSARTGSASSAAYHIVYREGQYKVFDKAQRFRCSFATIPAAQAYIESRTASHNNVLSDGPSAGSGTGVRQAQATEVAA